MMRFRSTVNANHSYRAYDSIQIPYFFFSGLARTSAVRPLTYLRSGLARTSAARPLLTYTPAMIVSRLAETAGEFEEIYMPQTDPRPGPAGASVSLGSK